MPDTPDPDTLEPIFAPSPQGDHSDLRIARGEFGSGDTRSSSGPRRVGAAHRPPQARVLRRPIRTPLLLLHRGPGPSATISMSVYSHATQDEIAAVGNDYILNEATGTRAEHSTSGQQANLWRRDGTLLVTTEQLCWYR